MISRLCPLISGLTLDHPSLSTHLFSSNRLNRFYDLPVASPLQRSLPCMVVCLAAYAFHCTESIQDRFNSTPASASHWEYREPVPVSLHCSCHVPAVLISSHTWVQSRTTICDSVTALHHIHNMTFPLLFFYAATLCCPFVITIASTFALLRAL